MGHIYQITNTTNGKKYIGFTSRCNYLVRFSEHLRHSQCKSIVCHRMSIVKAIRKYGKDCFTIESLVEDCDNLWLLKVVEPFLIYALSPEYNSTKGGEGVLGYKHKKETKLAMKLLKVGREASSDTRNKMSIAQKHRQSKQKPKPPSFYKTAREKFGHKIEADGISFLCKNDAVRHIMSKYGLSRTTAFRRLYEGMNDYRPKYVRRFNKE